MSYAIATGIAIVVCLIIVSCGGGVPDEPRVPQPPVAASQSR